MLAMIDTIDRILAMIDTRGVAKEYWLWFMEYWLQLTGAPTGEWLETIGYDWQENIGCN